MTPEDTPKQKPHLAWTAAVVGGLLALAGVAWFLWAQLGSSPGVPDIVGPSLPNDAPVDSGDPDHIQGPAPGPTVEAIEAALEAGRLPEAIRILEREEARWPGDPALAAARARVDFRVTAHRVALRRFEFRIESIGLEDEDTAVYARVSAGGDFLLNTARLAPSFEEPSEERFANLFTVSTSYETGITLELLEPGGMFGGPDGAFGPVTVRPLADLEAGRIELEGTGGSVARVTVTYRESPFRAGLTIDAPIPLPPADAGAPALLAATTAALADRRIADARTLHQRLLELEPGHRDGTFLGERISEAHDALRRNQRTVQLVALEVAADPRDGSKTWASGGDRPAFRLRVESNGEVLAKGGDGSAVPFLIPGDQSSPPAANRIELTARGDAPLTLVMVDAAPTFGTRSVGSVPLGLTLADLPRGGGTLILEREPKVRALPASDENRLRRVVLRWRTAD